MLGAASAAGQVFDTSGEPLEGVEVVAHAIRGDLVEQVDLDQTDEDGRFELERVPVGYLALEARGAGLARRVILVDVDPSGVMDVSIELEPGGVLAGRVLHEEQEGVSGARVCARSHQVGPVPELEAICATTDEDGEFLIDGVPIGLLAVAVDGEGIASMLRPDVIAPSEALVLRVTRRGGLRGTVRLPDGEVAAEAEVVIAGSGLWPPRVVRSDSEGTFLVENLPAGVYELEARTNQLVSQRELGVEIRAGQPARVQLELEQGYQLTGVVRDAVDGAPIMGAHLRISSGLLAPAPGGATSDEDGQFVIGGLYPGEQWLDARAEGRVPVTALRCTVPGEVEVAMTPEAAVTGQVVDERGYPIAGAVVEPDLEVTPRRQLQAPSAPTALVGSGGELGVFPGLEELDFDPSTPTFAGGVASTPVDRSALELTLSVSVPDQGLATVGTGESPSERAPWPVTSARDGTFRLGGLPAGTVTLTAAHPSTAPGRSRELTLEPGRTVDDVEIVLRQGTELHGRIVDTDGFPIDGALVALQGALVRQERTTVSASDGSYAFAAAAGTVTLSVNRSGYAPATVNLEVEPGEPRREEDLELAEAARTVRGRVVDRRDFPVAGAEVTVQSMAAGTLLAQRSLSSEDGTFVVEGLAAGSAVVTASAPGFSMGRSALEPGEDEATLWLERSGALVVEVVDPDTGDPVSGCRTEVLGADGPRRQSACVDGVATFASLPAGEGVLRVDAPNRAELERLVTIEPGAAVGDPDAGLRVELPLALTLTGQVLDVEGEPVPGARVALEPLPRLTVPRSSASWVVSAVEGRFELEGVAVDDRSVLYVDHPTAGRAELEVGPFYPADEPEVELWLEPGGRRTGRYWGVALELGVEAGRVVIRRVARSSAAEATGLRPGDRLVSVDGVAVSSVSGAARRLRGSRDTALMAVVRRGELEWSLALERELIRVR